MVDKWLYFFKHAEETSEKDLPKIIGQDEIIERAYEELNRFSWDEAEMNTYEQELKHEWDYLSIMRQRFDEGIEKGQREEKIKIAKTLLLQGVNVETVAIATTLSQEEITKLL